MKIYGRMTGAMDETGKDTGHTIICETGYTVRHVVYLAMSRPRPGRTVRFKNDYGIRAIAGLYHQRGSEIISTQARLKRSQTGEAKY